MSKCHASVRKTFSRVHKKREEKEISDKNLRFCVFDETWTSLESTQKQISQNRERFRMSKLDFDFFEFLLPEVTKKYLSLVVFRNCTLKLQSLKWRLHAVFRRCAKLFACEPYVQLRKWICWEEKVFFFRKPFVFWIFSQQCRVPFSQEFRLLNATSLRCVEADCSVTFCFSLLWRYISCYSSRIKTQGLVGQFLGQSRLLTIWIFKILYF